MVESKHLTAQPNHEELKGLGAFRFCLVFHFPLNKSGLGTNCPEELFVFIAAFHYSPAGNSQIIKKIIDGIVKVLKIRNWVSIERCH